MQSICRTALLLAALAPGLVLPSHPVEAQSPPVFGEEVDVRVVNVEAVVTDKDGQRVPGLKPEDFRLRVDGMEVPVEYFSEVREGNALPAPAASPESSASGAPAEEKVQGLTEGPVGTYYLVFVDDYFSIAQQRNRVLQKMKADVDRLRPEDRMAIVAYDGGRLVMLSNWSNSREELTRAFDKAAARPTHGLDRVKESRSFQNDASFADQRVGDNAPLDLSSRSAGLSPVQINYGETLYRQIRDDVQAAVGAMRGFAAPRGRKVLLLLSGGWPFSVRGYVTGGAGMPTHEIPEGDVIYSPLTRTANLLGYTIYPVELPEPGRSGADAEAIAPASSGFGNVGAQEIEGSLYFLAQETGGKPLLHGNRELALAQVQEDTRSFYWLGFSPSWQRNDKPHQIKLEVRRPGLKVRSRTDFLDLSRKAEVSMKVESALLFGNPPGAVTMPMKVGEPVRSKRGELEIPITLGLPVDLMTVLPDDGKYTVQLELRFAASSVAGNGSEIPVVPITLSSAKPPTPGKVVRYETKVKLHGTADHLVAAVYDPLSGKLATAEADLKKP